MGSQLRYGGNSMYTNPLMEFMVVFCIMCRLGFPGNLANAFGGETVRVSIDYGSSLLQVILILLTSGDSFNEIKLLDIKKKYTVIYLMMGLMFLTSLLVNANRVKQTTIIIRFTITALFGLWLADNYDAERLLELVYLAQIGILFSNLLALTVFRSTGFHVDEGYGYTFRGLYSQKNGLGGAFATGLSLQAALYRVKIKNKRPISGIFLAVFLGQCFFLVYSKATTALFTASLTILYLWVYDKFGGKELRFQWGIAYAVASIGFIIFALTIIPLFSPLFEAIGKDATLTGRAPMWRKIIAFMQESHTFTGYGLLQFWETPSALKALQNMYERDSWYRTMAFGAHNTLLEMWLDVGLLGVSAYLITLIYSFRNVHELSKEQYALCSVLMIPNLISGLTDRHYTNANYSTMFFFVMLGVACSRQTAAAQAVRTYAVDTELRRSDPGTPAFDHYAAREERS